MTHRGRFKIAFLPIAARALIGLRGPIQDHIRAAIRALADDPTPPHSLAMSGKGAGHYRIRVQDHRVIYRVKRERITVLIVRIGPRGDVYSGFEGE